MPVIRPSTPARKGEGSSSKRNMTRSIFSHMFDTDDRRCAALNTVDLFSHRRMEAKPRESDFGQWPHVECHISQFKHFGPPSHLRSLRPSLTNQGLDLLAEKKPECSLEPETAYMSQEVTTSTPSPAESLSDSQAEPGATSSVSAASNLTEVNNPTSPGLRIPEPRDGFFGYSDERGLRHVRYVRIP